MTDGDGKERGNEEIDNRKYYGLSTRAQHILIRGDMMRDTERATRDVVREKIRNGSIMGYRNCGKKTLRELEAWLDSTCAETDTVRCSTCAYFVKQDRPDSATGFDCGHCYRFPPVDVSRGTHEGLNAWDQPMVFPHETWCGEWKRKQ